MSEVRYKITQIVFEKIYSKIPKSEKYKNNIWYFNDKNSKFLSGKICEMYFAKSAHLIKFDMQVKFNFNLNYLTSLL